MKKFIFTFLLFGMGNFVFGQILLDVEGDAKVAEALFIGNSGQFKADGTASVGLSARLRPLNDNLYDLGTSTRKWKHLFLAGDAFVGTSIFIGNSGEFKADGTASIGLSARLRPLNHNLYDLGTSSRRWKHLFLAGDAFIGSDLAVTNNATINNELSVNGLATLEGLIVTQEDINLSGLKYTALFYGDVCNTGGGYFTCSDGNLKEKTNEIKNAGSLLKSLRPVEYEFKTEEYEFLNLPEGKQYGFIAQELEQVMPNLVKESNTPIFEKVKKKNIIQDENDKTEQYQQVQTGTLPIKSVNYIGLIPLLIANAQEYQVLIEEKEERIVKLERENQTIQQELATLKETVQQLIRRQKNPAEEVHSTKATLHKTASLKQNKPNPFNENTIIEYELPENVQKAQLRVTNVEGKLIKDIPLDKTGIGQVNLKSGTLPAGTYFYSLIADGQIIETLRMVIATR